MGAAAGDDRREDAGSVTRRGAARGRRSRSRRIGRRRAVLVVVGVLLLAALGAAGWFARDALRARDALTAAATEVDTLQDQVLAGSTDDAAATLTRLQAHADVAHRATDGILWRAATHLPWAGDDVGAVRLVADVVDDLAREGLPALTSAVQAVDPASLAPIDGRIDLEPLRAVAPDVTAGDQAVHRAQQRLADVPTEGLVDQVADPLTQARDRLASVAATTATAARAAELLPAMLGSAEPRDYLVLVQNNAELRATGGIPGSVLLLRAQDGRVEVADQRPASSLVLDDADPVLPLSDAELALFGADLGTDMRDVTFTPDFPRAAALARELWRRQVGAPVDGVLAIDPVAVSHLLSATGPVTLPDGTELSAQNAVARLLSDVYRDISSPAEQDEFFAATAGAVFDSVLRGAGDPASVVEALALSAREGRLLVWSADEGEQSRIAGTVVAGELAGASGSAPVVGVYLNDGTQAKMDFYLRTTAEVTAQSCSADGTQTLELNLSLTSTAPVDAATSLPAYVLGTDAVVRSGELRTNVLLYAPSGGGLADIRVDGAETGAFAQKHQNLAVGARTVVLQPGQTVRIQATVTTGPGQTAPAVVRMTPTAAPQTAAGSTSACPR